MPIGGSYSTDTQHAPEEHGNAVVSKLLSSGLPANSRLVVLYVFVHAQSHTDMSAVQSSAGLDAASPMPSSHRLYGMHLRQSASLVHGSGHAFEYSVPPSRRSAPEYATGRPQREVRKSHRAAEQVLFSVHDVGKLPVVPVPGQYKPAFATQPFENVSSLHVLVVAR